MSRPAGEWKADWFAQTESPTGIVLKIEAPDSAGLDGVDVQTVRDMVADLLRKLEHMAVDGRWEPKS